MAENKVVIVGAGMVGSTAAYAMVMGGTASEIVLLDVNRARAEGEAMDLSHGLAFVRPVRVRAGDYPDCREAAVVVLAAGVNQKPGETRLDLVRANHRVFQEVVPRVAEHVSGDTILLVVTNPVDILTYVAFRLSGYPPSRVIGSGTTLDSSRFRYLVGEHCGVDVRNVHAYIIGEHGDTEVAAWSLTNIAGARLEEYCPACGRTCGDIRRESIFQKVRDAAYHIIERKGATYYAIGLAIRRIVESIVRDENSVLTVSSLMEGQYEVEDVCLSLPSVVNRRGRERILDLPLSDEEREAFRHSALTIKQVLQELGY